jgi:aqualysin 1
MQRTTVTKLVTGLFTTGALALVGCQDPLPGDQEGDAQLDQAVVAGAADIKDPKAVPDEYIVVFREDGTDAIDTSIAAIRSSGAVVQALTVIPAVAGRFTPAQLEAVRKDPNVAYVEPNYIVSASTIFSNAPYGLDRIDSRTGTDGKFNDFGFNGSGVHIYVLDTGIRTSHREFTGRIGNGTSTINGSTSFQDCNGHGTHVASIAAGTRFGVAKRATVHPVRVLGCDGNGTTLDVIEGLQFVRNTVNAFPAVANMSLFGPLSQALNDAVAATTAADISVVAAAGNFAIDACQGSPASAPSAITVGATRQGEARATFSNFGQCVDIHAPGVGVIGAGTAHDDATATFDGTSQSAPHVAGAVALFLQRFPRVLTSKVAGGVIGNATPGIITGLPTNPFTVNLFLFIDFKVPPQQSCFGRCGGQSPDFSCGCDSLCDFFEDCCVDTGLFCPIQ